MPIGFGGGMSFGGIGAGVKRLGLGVGGIGQAKSPGASSQVSQVNTRIPSAESIKKSIAYTRAEAAGRPWSAVADSLYA